MKIIISDTAKELGKAASKSIANFLNKKIKENGYARIVVSTGASQLPMFECLVRENVDWSKVEMFHLDEYIGISETHIASFRKYLKERFVSKVNLMNAHFVDGSVSSIPELSEKLSERNVDLGIIGIGENAHIAFNDPPADFDTTESYIIVDLDDECKNQQVREGWFSSLEDVPKQAISMSVHKIMQSEKIISVVPYAVKAKAVKETLQNAVSAEVPATILKNHPNWELYLDKESASLIIK